MGNWMTFGLTSKKVGFEMEGSVCEGGNCEHLKEGDRAYGHSSENDSMGSEMYLFCKPCYEQFLEDRRNEPVSCSDCGLEHPRRDTKFYTPYDPGTIESERTRLQICKGCLEGDRHKRRLAIDQENIDRDRQWNDDREDELYDIDDDHDPDDD